MDIITQLPDLLWKNLYVLHPNDIAVGTILVLIILYCIETLYNLMFLIRETPYQVERLLVNQDGIVQKLKELQNSVSALPNNQNVFSFSPEKKHKKMKLGKVEKR